MKSIKLIKIAIGFAMGFLIILTSCKKDTIPTVNTLQISDITNTTASCGGDIIENGGDNIIQSGICWSSMGVPTISNSNTTDGSDLGTFTSQMTELEPGTAYTIRAYATNDVGTGYGNTMVFMTKSLPVIATNDVTEVTKTTAKSGGYIATLDDTSISGRGVCWCVCDTPTIEDYRTNDGSGTEDFISQISDLSPGTTYNIRAYATTEYGSSYGDIKTFTTNNPELPVVTTKNVTNVSDVSAFCGGNITVDGGAPVTSRGVIWGTNSSITLDNNIGFTENGDGTGQFSSSITGLNQNNTYFVKAYATNSLGTSYGSSKTFTTNQTVMPPTVEIDNINELLDHTALGSLAITSTGYGNITSKGLCWSTSSNPTTSSSHASSSLSETLSSVVHYYVRLNNLSSNTTYYVRAYATNSGGTGYSEEISFTTPQEFSCGNTIMDASGNTYNTIQFGGKCWMNENLKTYRLNNGHHIENGSVDSWGLCTNTTLSCLYDNDFSNANKYGRLYNAYAALNDDLCPTGWHVATKDEWESLTTTYGGASNAGGALKESGETYWYYCNDNTGTNSSDFSARGGGYRLAYSLTTYPYGANIDDDDMGNEGYWWTSSSNGSSELWYVKMKCFTDEANTYSTDKKKYGYSVRCVED